MSFLEIIIRGARELEVSLRDGAPEKLEAFYRLFEAKSREMNLTAIKGEEDSARLHFLDSLAVLRYGDFEGKTLVDVGTGGGFPGMPIAIARPECSVTLMDSTEKKVDFLSQCCRELFVDARCVPARAEEAGQGEYRESFDMAVSRAVARLNTLCELCLPLVKVGGVFLAMKALETREEVDEAARAIAALGGRLEKLENYSIPGVDAARTVTVIKKVSPSPAKYPRRFSQIKKSPL